jgi:hypothetical protein
MHFDELRDAFHLRLGHLTHALAQLDHNVGLTLNCMAKSHHLDISNLLDPVKARLSLRLSMLKKLLEISYGKQEPEFMADFADWHRRISQAHAIRNNYVHSKWEFCDLLDVEEPYVLLHAVDWNMLPDHADSSVKLTLNEFDHHVNEIKQLNMDFRDIYDNHAAPLSRV